MKKIKKETVTQKVASIIIKTYSYFFWKLKKEIIKYGFLQVCFLSGASMPNNLILLLLISKESPSIILGIPSKIKAKLFC